RSLLEIPDGLSQAGAELRQLRGAKEEQRQHQDDEYLTESESHVPGSTQARCHVFRANPARAVASAWHLQQVARRFSLITGEAGSLARMMSCTPWQSEQSATMGLGSFSPFCSSVVVPWKSER